MMGLLAGELHINCCLEVGRAARILVVSKGKQQAKGCVGFIAQLVECV